MLGSKKFEKTIFHLILGAVIFSLIIICFPNMFSWISNDKASEEYPVKLFGKNIINIEITADENEWNEMLENKMSKPYISCDLKIDGQDFENVGLRPKGNSSLTSIQSDRISFRLDFDQYIDNQDCYGLEQMVLNNLQADATYMKDYIAYDLMAYEGVDAPLHTYAFIKLNGAPFGVYLAAEVYDEDYLKRVYDDTDVNLYSVKSSGLDTFEAAEVDAETGAVVESKGMEEGMGMGGPGGPPPGGAAMPPQGPQPPQPPQGGQMPPQNNNQQPNIQPPAAVGGNGGPPQPPGGEGGGGDLVYAGESTDKYSTIFANAVSENTDAKDYAKVIRAIKYLNKENVTNEELERYWDVDAILRYLAVHTFMVNGDSYTGNMKQNYYIAEKDGKLTILPWDYNLSFGTFGGGPGGAPPGMNANAENQATADIMPISINDETTEVINHAIDTPTIGVDMNDRPLVSVLLGKEEYRKDYHAYLDHLTKYVNGEFISKLENIEKEIYQYIELEREELSFYTPQEHKNAFEVLKKFLSLRSESIQAQLDGRIPSTTEAQDGANLITADFSISEMGSMGGPGGGPPGMSGDNSRGEMMPPPPNMQGGNSRGAMMPPPPNMQGVNADGAMMPPPGMPPMGMHGMQETKSDITYVYVIISLAVLCIAFIGVKLYKRKY